MVTYTELFAFCLVIIGIIALIVGCVAIEAPVEPQRRTSGFKRKTFEMEAQADKLKSNKK